MLLPRRKRLLSILSGISLLLSMLSGCASEASSEASSAADSTDTAAGIAYLQSLDAQDPAEVDSILDWRHANDPEVLREEQLAQREEQLAQLESGEITCWSLFEDYMLCGDSRSVAFSYDGFLPESNVLAKSGATINDLEEVVPQVISAAPARIFLCYGMNDFCCGIWREPDPWLEAYHDVVLEIQRQLPDAQIYICSIIPASYSLTAAHEMWTRIYDYNDAMEVTIPTWENCHYIDLTELGQEHQELYKDDGKHFLPEFYDYWGTELIEAVYHTEYLADAGDGDAAADAEASSEDTDQTAASAEGQS